MQSAYKGRVQNAHSHVAMVLGTVYVLGRSIAWWQRGAKRVMPGPKCNTQVRGRREQNGKGSYATVTLNSALGRGHLLGTNQAGLAGGMG